MTSSPEDDPGRVYFPELDGLRAIAFAMVFLFHRGVPQLPDWIDSAAKLVFPRWRPAPPHSLGRSIVANGWAGVQVFFVLSGFLIATLLLREEKQYGKIDLKAFWMRRILRIWPLYYLTVFLTFFLLPLLAGDFSRRATITDLGRQAVPFLLFCGNWSMGLIGPLPFDAITILWSVCVEEQFYLFCPLLIAWVKPRRRVAVVLGLIGLGVACRWVASIGMARGVISPLLFQFATTTHLDTLLGGVLLALLWPVRIPLPIRAVILAAIAYLATRPDLAHGSVARTTLDFDAIGLATLGVVAWAASGRGVLPAILRYSRLVWLGKISFGLYMYHEIAMNLAKVASIRIGWFPNRDILRTIAGFALTVVLATASYYLFERPFLRWKQRWSRVRSRPNP